MSVLAALLLIADAQGGYLWTFDELNARADVVVIAESVRTVPTGTHGEHPELKPDVPVIELRTDLKVLSVLKAGAGDAIRDGVEIRLRHLRVDLDEWGRRHPPQPGLPPPGLVNVGTYLDFNARPGAYLLYLTRLADGSYQPVSGLTFPTDAVLSLTPSARQVTVGADETLPAVASELRAVQDDDVTSGPIPLRARQLMPALRRELATRVLRSLNAARDAPLDVIDSHARADVDAALQAAMSETAAGPYGSWADVRLAAVPGMADVAIAAIRIGIKCGDDTALYVFQRSFGWWRPVATLASSPSASIGDAWGSLDYAAEPDGHGGFLLAVADVNPWCSSNWQSLRYRVHRGSPSTLRRLFADRRTIYLGVDDPVFTIRLDRRRLELTFTGDSRTDEITEAHRIVYDVGDARVTRVLETPAALRRRQ